MYKIKLFNAGQPHLLEASINEWLHMNKDILIHSSNLSESNGSGATPDAFSFYILYTGADAQAEELKEMAAVVTQEQSIEVKDINPEILKPSS